MIQKARFDDELFIVLLPAGGVLERSFNIQKRLADYFKIYKNKKYPQLHITLDRVKSDRVEEVDSVIKKTVENKKPIEIQIGSIVCYQQKEDNYLVLKIQDSNGMKDLARKLHDNLAARKLSTIQNYEEWTFHITILSNIFADNPLSNQEFNDLCLMLEGDKTYCTSTSSELQLWSPTNDPAKRVIKSYDLSN